MKDLNETQNVMRDDCCGVSDCRSGAGGSRNANAPAGPDCCPRDLSAQEDEVCCGTPPDPPASPYARSGYRIEGFVEDFIQTSEGPVPRVAASTSPRDKLGTVLTRIGVIRNNYSVAPGLYSVGDPSPESPVLASANYKLSFDALRKELAGLNVWLLVLDSRGVNVWCAAGKNLFSTDEMVGSIRNSGLQNIVKHRRIITPQLGAVGVSAHEVLRRSGFKVVYGPVRASDIASFLENGSRADEAMRRVSFTFRERMVLVPVEIYRLKKILAWLVPVLFILSGISSGVFSVSAAWHRGILAVISTLVGILGGAVLSPALLPWLPGRSFALKGLTPGLVLGGMCAAAYAGGIMDGLAALLWSAAVSSYLSLYFTGSTPYTSPSGVEKEMKAWLPAQAAIALAALVLWLVSPFTG